MRRHEAGRGDIKESPARGLRLPRPEVPLPPAPPDERTIRKAAAMIDTTTPVGLRNLAMLFTFWSTGLRLSEFLALDLGDASMKSADCAWT